jgi:predicted alpha/beta-hydrolase family hydrolase
MPSVIPLSIALPNETPVSAVITLPQAPSCCLVFAHGAGGGMNHSYIRAVCDGLATRGVATLRYQFPYMEKGSRRPDPPKLCHQTVQSAVAAAHEHLPTLPLFAGGKSFGGRMTSQAQALAPLPHVRGLCFFGFPLHTPKQASTTRADHLSSITIPMLLLQGTRDSLADLPLIQGVVERLPAPVTLKVIDHADHSFHVLVRSGSTDAEVMSSMLDEVTRWSGTVVAMKELGSVAE